MQSTHSARAWTIMLLFLLQDTDSLMEWWYTVERESQSDLFSVTDSDNWAVKILNYKHLCSDCISEWDEVPSDEEDKVIQEDESKYVCAYEFDGSVKLILSAVAAPVVRGVVNQMTPKCWAETINPSISGSTKT